VALDDGGVTSEIEDDSEPPVVKSFAWRTPDLVKTLRLLDNAWCDMVIKRTDKTKRKAKIQTLQSTAGCKVEEGYGDIPDKIPVNWIIGAAKASLSPMEKATYSSLPPFTGNLSLKPFRLKSHVQPQLAL